MKNSQTTKVESVFKFLREIHLEEDYAENVTVVHPFPHKQGQLTGDCGYVLLAMVQLFWLYLGSEKKFFPAQQTDFQSFRGDSLMSLRFPLQINSTTSNHTKWGLFSAADYATIAQSIGYEAHIYQSDCIENLQTIIHTAITANIPVSMAFDVDTRTGGALIDAEGSHAHWGLIFGEIVLEEELYYLVDHGQYGHFLINAHSFCQSNLQLHYLLGHALDLAGKIILVFDPLILKPIQMTMLSKLRSFRIKNDRYAVDLSYMFTSSFFASSPEEARSWQLTEVTKRRGIGTRLERIAPYIDDISFNNIEKMHEESLLSKIEFKYLIALKFITNPAEEYRDYVGQYLDAISTDIPPSKFMLVHGTVNPAIKIAKALCHESVRAEI